MARARAALFAAAALAHVATGFAPWPRFPRGTAPVAVRGAAPSASDDAAWMLEAAGLAATAGNETFPNPRVGCVVVDDEGNAIGRGFHPKAGAPHAEIFALRDAGVVVERDAGNASAWAVDAGDRVRGATAYVTLEPCSHVGRTPPCCDALVAAGVARVVIGMPDPAPWVDGAGVGRLRAAGVAVDVGVEEAACEALNAEWVAKVRALPRDG